MNYSATDYKIFKKNQNFWSENLHIFFQQVIKARFGKRTHLVFCTFAFFTNLIVMMSLTIAGTAVLNRWEQTKLTARPEI